MRTKLTAVVINAAVRLREGVPEGMVRLSGIVSSWEEMLLAADAPVGQNLNTAGFIVEIAREGEISEKILAGSWTTALLMRYLVRERGVGAKKAVVLHRSIAEWAFSNGIDDPHAYVEKWLADAPSAVVPSPSQRAAAKMVHHFPVRERRGMDALMRQSLADGHHTSD